MALSQSRRARASRRRARRVAAADNDLTLDEWASLVEAWGACAYCGVADGSLQKDCVLPISRGGRYTFENVVPGEYTLIAVLGDATHMVIPQVADTVTLTVLVPDE